MTSHSPTQQRAAELHILSKPRRDFPTLTACSFCSHHAPGLMNSSLGADKGKEESCDWSVTEAESDSLITATPRAAGRET